MKETRLAIIMTHPIRFMIPLIQQINAHKNISVKVFFTIGSEILQTQMYNPSYRKTAEWGVPLFEGYEYEFAENIAKNKSSFHFNGIHNPGIIKCINDWRPSSILICGWKFRSHLKLMRYYKNKIPVFFRGDSTLLDEWNRSIIKRTLRSCMLTWVYRHIDKALYVGTNNKEYYKKFGLKDNQLIYAPHAIDNDRFTNFAGVDKKAMLLKMQLGIGTDEIVILFAGRFQPKKNVQLLLKAFILAEMKNTTLLLCGRGILEAELKATAEPYDNIHFLPHQTQTNMPVIYKTGDVFILPSCYDETWGLVINEAMACGLPIVASDRCGSAIDLIEEGKNGHIFSSGNTLQLSGILKTYAENKSKIKEQGNYSKEKIKSFSYSVLVPVFENIERMKSN